MINTLINRLYILKQVRIGNRSYLSKIDIQQVNMMYKCNGGGGGNPPPPPPGKENLSQGISLQSTNISRFHYLNQSRLLNYHVNYTEWIL